LAFAPVANASVEIICRRSMQVKNSSLKTLPYLH
jgi:hypothetical protein